MSRETFTRIRCSRCFYGYNECVGNESDVDAHLQARGWAKDDAGNDICSFCVEAETARGKRLAEIRVMQAHRLLSANGLLGLPIYAAAIIAAQDAAIAEIQAEQAVEAGLARVERRAT